MKNMVDFVDKMCKIDRLCQIEKKNDFIKKQGAPCKACPVLHSFVP